MVTKSHTNKESMTPNKPPAKPPELLWLFSVRQANRQVGANGQTGT